MDLSVTSIFEALELIHHDRKLFESSFRFRWYKNSVQYLERHVNPYSI
jgi:hypothetical protein